MGGQKPSHEKNGGGQKPSHEKTGPDKNPPVKETLSVAFINPIKLPMCVLCFQGCEIKRKCVSINCKHTAF